MTRSARIGATGLLALATISAVSHGCGSSRRPHAAATTYAQVGPVLPGDAARIERALRAWDAAGYPALAVRIELRDPDPLASQRLGVPGFVFLGSDYEAVVTPPEWGAAGSIACTRGSEHQLAHELLHVLHQVEGHAPDPLHADSRWGPVNALRDRLRGGAP